MSFRKPKQSPYRFVSPSSNPALQTPTPSISTARPQQQFASTPRYGSSRKESAVQHRNDNSIEDPDSSPTLPSRPPPLAVVTKKEKDAILDDNDNVYYSNYGNQAVDGTDIDKNIIADQAQGAGYSDSSADELTNPFTQKRRREKRKREHTIETSSSPPSSPRNPLSDTEDLLQRQSSEPSSSLAIRSPTTSKTPLRFRHTGAVSPHSDTLVPNNKPSFRLPPAQRENSTYSIGLPDAFSPSRRRSKGKEYIAGGMADTFRGWVIGMTAEEHGQRYQGQMGTTEPYKRIVEVRQLRRDESHRCITVVAKDGDMILLLGEGGNSGRQSLREGCRVGLRGGQLYWEIEIPLSNGQPMNKVGVSALWDVLGV